MILGKKKSFPAYINSRQDHLEGAALQPLYLMAIENRQYVCEVILPRGAGLTSMRGFPSSRKAIAKRSAAYEMCIALLKEKYLDNNFVSNHKNYVPANANLRCAVKEHNSNEYRAFSKPKLWERSRGSFPTKLYLTVLQLAVPTNLGRPSQPLALVTRTPLPDFPPMELHLSIDKNKNSDAICISISKGFGVARSTVEKLNNFTLSMYKDLHNKVYEDNILNMSYWLAPVLNGQSIHKDCPNPETLIDWSIVDFADIHNMKNPIKWYPGMPHEELAHRFVVDSIQGRRRFYSEHVLPEVRPTDPVPECAFKERSEHMMKDILSYSDSFNANQKKSPKSDRKWVPDQPVIKARKATFKLDWLNEFVETAHSTETICYICPEPMYISAVGRTYINCIGSYLTSLAAYIRCLYGIYLSCGFDAHRIAPNHARGVRYAWSHYHTCSCA